MQQAPVTIPSKIGNTYIIKKHGNTADAHPLLSNDLRAQHSCDYFKKPL